MSASLGSIGIAASPTQTPSRTAAKPPDDAFPEDQCGSSTPPGTEHPRSTLSDCCISLQTELLFFCQAMNFFHKGFSLFSEVAKLIVFYKLGSERSSTKGKKLQSSCALILTIKHQDYPRAGGGMRQTRRPALGRAGNLADLLI